MSVEQPHSPLRYSLPSVLALTILMAGLLIWQGWSEYTRLRERQSDDAAATVRNTADRIALHLQGLSRSLNLFAELEHDRINALASDPGRKDLHAAIWKQIRTHFPTAFAFTLTDHYGISLVSHPDNSAESPGHLELLQRVADQTLPIDLHVDDNGYHFHVLANWQNGDDAIGGQIIVSYRCGILCQMLLQDKPKVKLLPNREQTALNALVSTPAVPERSAEISPVLAEARIPGSNWNVAKLTDAARLHTERNQLIIEKLIILGFLALSFLLLVNRAVRSATAQGENARFLQGLRENEKQLGAIVEAAGEGIILADAEGTIRLFNPAAEAMFGYTREEAVGSELSILLPRSLHAESSQYLSRFPANGDSSLKEATREVSGRRKNGDEFPIRISVSRYDLEGEVHYVGLIQDISEQINARKRVDYLSTHDALTGLMNRREFERLLESLLSIPDTKDQRQVLCYIDVDQFKVINDTLGHIAGDDVLKQIGLLIKAQLRESGTIARLGGDEFAVLLPDCSIERAQELAHGLLQTISNFLFIWKDKSYEMGVSIGLAEINPHSDIGGNVLSAADVACLMAKEQGRNRIHVYHPGDVDLIRHHGDMLLVSGITQALNEERFHLYAQPIAPVNPASKEQKHYEVLVRMVDEKGDLVVPEHFIPAAERYILMPAVDRWVINHLFSTQGENLRSWSRLEQGRGFLFAINLSGTSLSDEGFLSYIKRQFSKWEIPHDAICFEVTETAAIANLARARELISNLKELGCYFALDDFGAGLSSFSYLRDLPVDYLKIDGSFVRHMAEDPVDYAMVESINQIGHILGLKTIAEWAEDNATLNQLRALNVDFAQGYGVGEPEPMHSFTIH